MRSKVFVAGDSGYKALRIPGIVAAHPINGTSSSAAPDVLVAYAEGRKYGCNGFGDQHDIVPNRSTDSGASACLRLSQLKCH